MVDFDAVRANAQKQGIDLSVIAIFYEGLTPVEMLTMHQKALITHVTGDGTAIARFGLDGQAAFPEKATGVHCLAAD